MFNVTTDLSM